MNCLRCNKEMKHYVINKDLNIYGSWYKPDSFLTERQKLHNPQSVYVCDSCGYVEFSMNPCENPDI